jgi:hypothetical protein
MGQTRANPLTQTATDCHSPPPCPGSTTWSTTATSTWPKDIPSPTTLSGRSATPLAQPARDLPTVWSRCCCLHTTPYHALPLVGGELFGLQTSRVSPGQCAFCSCCHYHPLCVASPVARITRWPPAWCRSCHHHQLDTSPLCCPIMPIKRSLPLVQRPLARPPFVYQQ